MKNSRIWQAVVLCDYDSVSNLLEFSGADANESNSEVCLNCKCTQNTFLGHILKQVYQGSLVSAAASVDKVHIPGIFILDSGYLRVKGKVAIIPGCVVANLKSSTSELSRQSA